MVKKTNKGETCDCGSDCHCGCHKHDGNSFVAIPASVAGITLGMVFVFGIFARDSFGLMIPIAWAMATLGIFALFFNFLAVKAHGKSPKK